jgi:hypothetical protein
MMRFDFAALEGHIAQLTAKHRYDEAEALLRPFVRSGMRAPVPVWKLLVNVLRQQGKIEETRRIQEMLVSLAPEDLTARLGLAETLLLQGEYERGWREYRCRYKQLQCPRWEGEPITGKTLLIHDEPGSADTLQFLRLVPLARQLSGARVILQINSEQLPLATRAGGFDAIVSREEPAPPADLHCEMMSLPTAMNLRLDDLPGPSPYLTAEPSLVAQWRARLASLPKPWVGLHCSDTPTHASDPANPVSLQDLAALAMAGVTFVSLQENEQATQLQEPPQGMRLVSLGEECRNVEDLAALVTLLDLVISADSSVAHLAGALGRPVWILLPFVHDWRWMLSRTDTPWYPTARLFRQAAPLAWEPVIREVAGELGKLRLQ